MRSWYFTPKRSAITRRRSTRRQRTIPCTDLSGPVLTSCAISARCSFERRGSIDGRTTRHGGYRLSQNARKRIEEAFGWMKEIALMRRVRHRGKRRIGWHFTLAATAYNLIRLPKLLETAS